MQVKFCGFTEAADIQAAVTLGADAIGLVFYPPSPRAVDIETARELVKAVPAFVSITALVVNISAQDLQTLADSVCFDVVQFHGDESPEQCQALAGAINKRWIKALRVNKDTHSLARITDEIAAYSEAGASSVLLDAYHKDAYGGTGHRFDWSLIPNDSAVPLILAGGLTPDNAADTLHLPIQALDVSGGIEYAKGKKDKDKMQAFIAAASGN
ncbi:phosphoribosylanthranilate isomerase [Psychrobacter aestuarii]|uniref:N-(5'-phosphoribosyl)anthranilate isomerase n=1 Tax=Psychrobacter aestuarii TaxID=556327 RepID=A0ABN0VV92_9GAMM|nr:phosphoribosylanthranilate isomerase [Psychrobacter aestuarii]